MIRSSRPPGLHRDRVRRCADEVGEPAAAVRAAELQVDQPHITTAGINQRLQVRRPVGHYAHEMPFMNESELRGAIEDVRRGKLSRRTFTARMIAFGLTAPMATQMLVSSGVAASAAQPDYKPTRRGGGGV